MNGDTFAREIAAGAIFAALAGAALWYAAALPANAAMFPRMAAGLLDLFALAHIVRVGLARRRTRTAGPNEEGAEAEEAEPFFQHPGRFAAAFALIAVYAVVFPRIGYFTASLVFVPAFILTMGMLRPLVALACTIAFLVLVYLLFVVFLGRPLPPDALLGLVG